MPNFTGGTIPLGGVEGIGTFTSGTAPKITGRTFGIPYWSNGSKIIAPDKISGAFSLNSQIDVQEGSAISTGAASADYRTYKDYCDFDASRSSSAYSRTDNCIIPKGRYVRYIIKY